MTSSYLDVGNALFAFASAIDITAVESGGWGETFNRVYQPDEVTNGHYPTLMVLPAEDEGSTLDSQTDADRIVYWVVISTSMTDVLINGEDGIRTLADLVRNAFREERLNPNGVFGQGDAYDLQFTGTWGWDTERAERFYKLVATVNVAQPLI